MSVARAPLIHGRFDRGFAWIAQPEVFMERSSTALAVDGRVWLVDPERAEGIQDEIAALGTPAGIISTVGWHDRDVDWFAALYGIPVYGARFLRNVLFKAPLQRVDGTVPGTPFRLLNTSMRGVFSLWTESALWWPEEALLVTGDCLGTASYFVRPGERLGAHPIARISPPISLRGVQPEHIYCGHGRSVHQGATAALQHAIATARSELPSAWLSALRSSIRRVRARRSSAALSR